MVRLFAQNYETVLPHILHTFGSQSKSPEEGMWYGAPLRSMYGAPLRSIYGAPLLQWIRSVDSTADKRCSIKQQTREVRLTPQVPMPVSRPYFCSTPHLQVGKQVPNAPRTQFNVTSDRCSKAQRMQWCTAPHVPLFSLIRSFSIMIGSESKVQLFVAVHSPCGFDFRKLRVSNPFPKPQEPIWNTMPRTRGVRPRLAASL